MFATAFKTMFVINKLILHNCWKKSNISSSYMLIVSFSKLFYIRCFLVATATTVHRAIRMAVLFAILHHLKTKGEADLYLKNLG